MKKMVFMLVAMLAMTSTVLAQEITLDGSWAMLKEKGTYMLWVVYNDMKIGDKSVEEFLKTQDEKFVNDWNNEVVPQSMQYALLIPNYANKKFTVDQYNPQYKFLLKLNTLDLGFGGGAFIPFAGAKAGGAEISGELQVFSAKDELLGTMTFKEVKGVSVMTDAQRWGMSYYELGNRLKKAVKKYKE